MYNNLLFFPLSSWKIREEEKENKVAKPVLNKFFSDPFNSHPVGVFAIPIKSKEENNNIECNIERNKRKV